MAHVTRLPLARKDLRAIGRYITKKSQSVEVALRFLDSIEARCRIYATQPLMGERCPELGDHVRRFSVGDYVVYYEPIRNGIRLLRVLHGARDIFRAWQGGFSEED